MQANSGRLAFNAAFHPLGFRTQMDMALDHGNRWFSHCRIPHVDGYNSSTSHPTNPTSTRHPRTGRFNATTRGTCEPVSQADYADHANQGEHAH